MLRNFLISLSPLFLFLLFLFVPIILFQVGFSQYLKLVKILIWPFTIMSIVFFFKEVLTYLTFSVEKFNFFGIEGKLKNVKDVIREEADKLFNEEGREKKKNSEIENLRLQHEDDMEKSREKDLTNEQYAQLLNQSNSNYDKAADIYENYIRTLNEENERLKSVDKR